MRYKTLGYETYGDYLRSDHWAVVRDAALVRAGHRCQVCNSDDRPVVHHRDYDRLGSESPMDLTVLCATCHSSFHRKGTFEDSAVSMPVKSKGRKKRQQPQPCAKGKATTPLKHRVRAAIGTYDEDKWFTEEDLAATMGTPMPFASVQTCLYRLADAGELEQRGDLWKRTSEFGPKATASKGGVRPLRDTSVKLPERSPASLRIRSLLEQTQPVRVSARWLCKHASATQSQVCGTMAALVRDGDYVKVGQFQWATRDWATPENLQGLENIPELPRREGATFLPKDRTAA